VCPFSLRVFFAALDPVLSSFGEANGDRQLSEFHPFPSVLGQVHLLSHIFTGLS
jgi:hypothetical protein